MTLPGSSGVSASGAATYGIPIALPPGTAGMSPALSLDYNSQAGNGLLGMGWSLSGLPAIGRCPLTQAQDLVRGSVNFDPNDRFCLDGQRMVRVVGGQAYGADGTEYRTEIDGFSKIISHGTAGTGPAWFEVRTKAGQVMEFGNTVDSRVLAQGKPTARSWALNKVSDTKGNYFTVSYANDNANGQLYPSRIYYTGNASAGVAPFNEVQFLYAARPDVTPAYHAGSLMQTTVRLTNVKILAAGALVSDYRLAYQQSPVGSRSEISSIAVCGGDGACLPATAFRWASGGNGTFSAQTTTITNGWMFGNPPSANFITINGDFNGDGKSDLVLLNGAYTHALLSNGDGTFVYVQAANPNGWNFGSVGTGAGASGSGYVPISGDFNGDGKADFAMLNGTATDVFLSNGDGTFIGVGALPHPNGWNFGSPLTTNYTPIPGDYNGDGKTDIAMLSTNHTFVFMSNGDGSFTGIGGLPNPGGWGFDAPPSANVRYVPIPGDFNGDGKSDIAVLDGANTFVFFSNGDGTFSGVGGLPNPNGWGFGYPLSANYTPVPGDYNGDGKADIALLSAHHTFVFLSHGDGTFTGIGGLPLPNGWGLDAAPSESTHYLPIPGDFNGDGKSDIALQDGNYTFVFFSNGDGTFSGVGGLPNPGGWGFGYPITANYAPFFGDFNGDGKSDFALMDGTHVHVGVANGSSGDVMTTVTTGLGVSTTFTYAPLTSAGVYSKDSGAAYPVQDTQAPIYVVSRVDAPNGAGGVYSSSYTYAGAKVDLNGRGFLGFRQMTIKDLQTNLVQTTTYRQDFPFIGSAASSAKTLGSLTLSQATNSYQVSNASGGGATTAGNAPYRVALSQNVTTGRDLDGSVLPSVTTSYQYDAYGNATQVVASTSDGFSKTTTNTYSNDTTLWLLGRLTRASVTSQSP